MRTTLFCLLIVTLFIVQIKAQINCGTAGSWVDACIGFNDASKQPASSPLITLPSNSDIVSKFELIDATGLCQSCKNNIKRLVCQLSFPYCGGGKATIPQKSICTATFSGCTPADAPAEIKAVIDAAFASSLPNGLGNCDTMYSPFEGVIASFISYHTDYTPQTQTGCTASVPSGLTFCSGHVDYPVWDGLLTSVSTLESTVQTAYNEIKATVQSVDGLFCAACDTQLKKTMCTTTFFKAPNAAANQLFQSPCKSVCTDFVTACRLDQVLDQTLLDFADSQGMVIDTTAITEALGKCDASPYATSSCNAGSYTAESRCPCVVPELTGVCASYVDYGVFPVLNGLSADIELAVETAIGDYLQYEAYVCPNCWDALVGFACTTAFPHCNNNQVLQLNCEGTCSNALDTCKLPFLNSVCTEIAKIVTVKPAASPNCFTPPTLAPCECATSPLPAGVCQEYVNYPVFPAAFNNATNIQNEVKTITNQFAQFKSFVCDECWDSLVGTACEVAFPRCTSTNQLVPPCDDTCSIRVQSCNVPAVTAMCTQIPNPYAALPLGNECHQATAPTGPGCSYCGSRTLKNCGTFINWDTFTVSLPGFDPATFDAQIGAFFPTIKFPGCKACEDQIKRTLCSIFVLPCSTDIIDQLLQLLLLSGGGTSGTDLVNQVPRPCYTKCKEVFAACLLTLNPKDRLFFSCDTKFPGVNFDLFSKQATCYNHTYPTLPPPECPLLRTPPPTPVKAPPPTVPTEPVQAPDNVTNITPETAVGDSSGGIAAGIIIVVILAAFGGAMAFIWYKKLFWFKVPQGYLIENEMHSPSNGGGSSSPPSNYGNTPGPGQQPPAAWRQSVVPSGNITNLKS